MPKEPFKLRLQRRFTFATDLLIPSRLRANAQQAIPFWIASLFVGLIAVGYTKLFGLAEDILHHLLAWHGWLIFLVTPFCFLLAWLVVVKLSPNAKGSGIPQVMAAIDLATPKHEDKIGRLLSLRIAAVKILSSFVMVLGGGAIGREGPTIQIAGSVFYIVHKWIPKTWARLSDQSFVLTGAAAGLAAAFNTPLGGIVFAVEELAKIHVRHFRTALFSAVIIAGLTAQGFLGPYLYLGYPEVTGLRFSIFLGVIATAIAAGLLGSLMCKAILVVMRWKRNFGTAKTVLFLLLSGLAVAAAAYFVHPAVLGSGKVLMNQLLFTSDKAAGWDTALLRVAGPIICFNTGAAGGVFAPSLAAGASIGGWLSSLFDVTGSNANLLILCGMVGFLTGVTRTPFTSAILVLEMTDRHSVIFHLMVAALVSNVAALLIDKHSLYERLKKGYVEDALKEETEPVAN
ncbi:chloride channel protein [Flavisolibacter ginsenosidimutans]|uniref:Chloride channel protein n=1 Tax=Flavisolibacter ginsenosidimutans TaxID=661481 RepID=A0A5B8UJ98_9BACT|nr:chloride channel protein [Flavisolibacter ginsenosidimutans]QEC56757.1 chloride channel protein [Flavisolibacter ginsenosidimutans]